MDAKELMIGDWVYLKNGKVLQPCKITVIGNATQDRSEIGATVCLDLSEEFPTCLFSIDSIEPIPLTPEILEKNGFLRLGNEYNIWYMQGFNFSLDFINGFFGYYEQGKPHNPTFVTKYVHELQHALRLCRIEKNIEP